MSKRTMEELKELLNHELDMLTKKGEVTKESLEYFDKLTHTLKSLEYIMQNQEGGSSQSGGYSQEGGYSRRGNYSRNDGYSQEYSNEGYSQGRYRMPMGGMSYEGGSSYARRGRDGDGDGRYSERGSSMNYSGEYSQEGNSYNRGQYSRHTAKERMIEKLTDMMEEATTESERMALRRCINQLG